VICLTRDKPRKSLVVEPLNLQISTKLRTSSCNMIQGSAALFKENGESGGETSLCSSDVAIDDGLGVVESMDDISLAALDCADK